MCKTWLCKTHGSLSWNELCVFSAHVSESRDFEHWPISVHCFWSPAHIRVEEDHGSDWGGVQGNLGTDGVAVAGRGLCTQRSAVPGEVRGTGLWTPKCTKSPRKGSRASGDGEGLPGLKVDKTHKSSSPEEDYGKWGLMAHLYSQPQEVKPWARTTNTTNLSVRSGKKRVIVSHFCLLTSEFSHMYVCDRVVCTSYLTAKDSIGCSGQNIPFPQVLLSPACVPCGWW